MKLPAWDSFLVFEPGKRVCPTRVTGCGLGVARRGLCDDPWGSRRFRYSPRPHRRPDGTRAGACRRWCRQNSPSGSPPVHFESPSPAQGSSSVSWQDAVTGRRWAPIAAMDDGRYPQAVATAQSVRWVACGLFPASFGRSRASRPAADAARFALFFKRNPEIRVVPTKELRLGIGPTSKLGPPGVARLRARESSSSFLHQVFHFSRSTRPVTVCATDHGGRI